MISESMISEFLQRRKDEEEKKQKIIENEQEYRDVVNRIFTSEDGQIFYKYMLKFCRVHTYDQTGNALNIVKDDARRAVFLEAIRAYLNKETRVKLEDIV